MITDTEDPARPFASPARLRQAFETRLVGLLDHDLLGVFILVLANAGLEPEMLGRLRVPLTAAYARWCERFDLADERALHAAPDDRAVFERLRALGVENLQPTRWRRVGPWELQFNPLRALRPARISDTPVVQPRRPFDPAGFHFDRPFLRREVFWEGELAGAPVRLLYNKFPFAELHGLLVPHPAAQRPQYLERHDHRLAWEIVSGLGARLPGIGLAYNAYGAYASVNHLHFQMFMRSAGTYPIESACWQHNGGPEPYPLPVQRHDDPVAAWSAVQRLHATGTVYNLLYRPGRVYVVPRAMQGTGRHSDWTGGFAWSEVAGTVTVFDPLAFARLNAQAVEAEMAGLAPSPA